MDKLEDCNSAHYKCTQTEGEGERETIVEIDRVWDIFKFKI